jgi:hypothetical protein
LNVTNRRKRALVLLDKVHVVLASLSGQPVEPELAAESLGICAVILRGREAPISVETFDAMTALIEALRREIA